MCKLISGQRLTHNCGQMMTWGINPAEIPLQFQRDQLRCHGAGSLGQRGELGNDLPSLPQQGILAGGLPEDP